MLETNEYYLNLARQYLEEGLEHKARGIILTYRKSAPKDANFHVQWAELCAELGMTKQARESYEQAIHLAPDHADNIYLYASLLYDLGYYEEAIHYLKKAIKKEPDHKKAREILSEIYFELGMDGLARALKPGKQESASPLRYFPASISHEDIKRFTDLFACGGNGYALQKINHQNGSLAYDFYDRPLSHEDVERHLNGTITLAGFPLLPDKTIKFGVIEIRIRRRVLESNLKNEGYLIFLNENAREHSFGLKKMARQNHIPAFVEDTGDHSHRIWFFFKEFVHFLKVKSFLKRFLKEADLFDSRFTFRPLLPTSGIGLGWIEEPLFLPLGIHMRTMKRSLFINEEDFRSYEEQLKFLKTIRPIMFNEDLKGFPRYFAASLPSPEDRLDILTTSLRHKCPVLELLCQKALQGRLLNYTEKVILFYTIGLVDVNGLSMHRLLESCPDYQYQKVEKQRVRLKPHPISCVKIRELIPAITREILCDCSFDLKAGHYPSPLLHINPNLVPTNKDLLIPDNMPAREAAERYIRVNDQLRELKKIRENLLTILDRYYKKTGISKIDIRTQSVCRHEVDQVRHWTVEFTQ